MEDHSSKEAVSTIQDAKTVSKEGRLSDTSRFISTAALKTVQDILDKNSPVAMSANHIPGSLRSSDVLRAVLYFAGN